MEIKRHHIIALVVIQVLMAVVGVIEAWPKRPPGYITVEGALVCPSPDTLQLVAARSALAASLDCWRYPAGVRVDRAANTPLDPPGSWKVFRRDNLEERGWGWRRDFRMPDGSVILEDSAA